MPYTFPLRNVLIGAPRHTPLRVRNIVFEHVRDRCASRGVRVGDELRCLGATSQHVILELPSGSAVELELALSTCIEVEPIDTPLTT
jgi:hypothetical protein